MSTVGLVLALVALVFAVIELVRSRGNGLLVWAVALLALVIVLMDAPFLAK